MSHVVKRFGIEINLARQRHTGCPKCIKAGRDKSRDNFAVYGIDDDGLDGGGHCFSCGFTIPSQKIRESSDEEEEQEDILGSEFNDDVHDRLKEITNTDGKGYRGIRKDINRFFGVRYMYNEETGDVERTYYPCTTNYELTGYKVRTHPKNFKYPGPIGETGKGCDLFGQWRFRESRGKFCVVTSGEHDCLAAFQMLKDYSSNKGYEPIPVVSSTVGESGSHKQIANQYEWFNRFDKIILCYDMDDAGRDAVDKIAKVLPKKKLYVMELPLKDANVMLDEGKERQFIDCFFKAKQYVPSGIVGSGGLLDKVRIAEAVPRVPLPPFMQELQKLMAGGIPLKKIVNLGSASGTGKSTIIDEMVYYWIFNSPHRVGIVTLESDVAEYGKKLLSRHIAKKIDLIEDYDQRLAFLSSDEVEEASANLFYTGNGEHRFHLIDERDGGTDDIKELVMQLAIQCECRLIIFDPLSDIFEGLGTEEQASFMKWMKGMTKTHDVTFVNVNHVRKNSGDRKANSTGADLHEEDFFGSSSIFKSGACNLLFTRDKEAEDALERNTTYMKMTKCRWTGRTSPHAGKYYYDNETHTLHDYDDWVAAHPALAEF